MKTKKWLLVALVASIGACGKSEAPPPSEAATTTTSTTIPTQAPTPRAEPDASAQEATAEETTVPADMEEPAEQGSPAKEHEEPASSTTELSKDEALALAQASGCLACHAIDKKLVGPAWADVGARYKGNEGAKTQLIEKVKKGGKGNWTEVTGGVQMPPYSPRVSDENIEMLVTFILSLG